MGKVGKAETVEANNSTNASVSKHDICHVRTVMSSNIAAMVAFLDTAGWTVDGFAPEEKNPPADHAVAVTGQKTIKFSSLTTARCTQVASEVKGSVHG